MKASFFNKVKVFSVCATLAFIAIIANQAIAATTQYEAENATLSGGANKNTNHTGYSGTGFIDGFYNSTTAQVSFAANGTPAGSYTVTLHYSAGNGTSTNTGLYVNGTKIKNITCNTTSNWDTWANEVETVTLNAGNNTIAYKADVSSSSCINLDYISVANVTYSLTMANDGHGTTNPSGTVTVNSGAATSITATAATGYQFLNWTVTSGTATIANSSSASTTVTLTSGNATVRANFTAVAYSLTMTNDGHGTTTPSGIVSVNYGAATPINATPATGYQFVSWTVTSGTATIANSSSASTTVTLTSGNATVQANFTTIAYSLTMSNDGHGSTTPSGTVTVNYGAATPITATAATGYQFLNWTVTSGTATIANSSSASTTVTLTAGNATVRANFTQQLDTLTVSNNGHGSTVPSGSVGVARGAAVTVTATANGGYHFVAWTVVSGTAQIANPASSSTTVTLTAGNAVIRADFAVGVPAAPNSRQIAITGMLYDQNGRPVGSPTSTTVEMTVRVYSQATGGDTLYREDFLIGSGQGIPVDSGLFVARLGAGTTMNDLPSVISSHENLWAEITVLGAQPDVLAPRTPVNASPYAFSHPAAAALEKTLHGQGNPNVLSIVAPIGSYYVNDADGTTWVRINNGWRMMD